VAIEAIFHQLSGKEGVPKGQQIWDDIRDAAQEDYLHISDDSVSVNEDDPKISRYMAALNDIERFLNSLDEEATFIGEYKDEYDHRPFFSSRKLWEEHLGLMAHAKW